MMAARPWSNPTRTRLRFAGSAPGSSDSGRLCSSRSVMIGKRHACASAFGPLGRLERPKQPLHVQLQCTEGAALVPLEVKALVAPPRVQPQVVWVGWRSLSCLHELWRTTARGAVVA